MTRKFFQVVWLGVALCSCSSNPIKQLSRQVPKSLPEGGVILLGDEHQNGAHTIAFVELIRELERTNPGKLKLIGLEVYSIYQTKVDRFLESGKSEDLEGTLDNEVFRGHKKKVFVQENFKSVYTAVKELNEDRGLEQKIQIALIDHKPVKNKSLREWRKSVSKSRFFEWVFTRDQKMFSNFDRLQSKLLPGDLSVVFIGSAHIQKSGTTVLFPQTRKETRIRWLGSLISEKYPTLVVNQNDPSNACEDKVEKVYSEKNSKKFIDLRELRSDQFKNFRCPNEFPMSFSFSPERYLPRDHYDFYLFYPNRENSI